MIEPWDDPTWQAWRVYADYLMEMQAPASQIKRAVKFALGLQQRPKLVLLVQLVGDMYGHEGEYLNASSTCGLLAGSSNWSTLTVFTDHHWVVPQWYRKQATRLCGNQKARKSEAVCLATPADFPGMTAAPPSTAEAYSLGWDLTCKFYQKVSEVIGVRCRNGVIMVRRSRKPRGAPWTVWDGA